MKKIYGLLAILLTLLFGVFILLKINTPVKIALIGDFEEEGNSFCTTSLFAARIAEGQINKDKGIFGRKIKIIIKNTNFSDTETLFEELKKENVELIISTATSENLVKIEPFLKKYDMICISANATATSLSGIEDNIYKLLPDDAEEVQALFDHIEKANIEKNFTIIYNKENKEYVTSVENEIVKRGGRISYKITWQEHYELFQANYPQEIANSSAILTLCSATESAFVAQKLNMIGIKNKPIFSFSWSGDYNLIDYGGKSIEGFTVVTPIDISSKYGHYDELEKELARFNKKNSMITATTYEAIYIARDIYGEKFTKHKSLKSILSDREGFEGIESKISFDKYGDSKRKEYILRVNKGEFSKVEDK